MPGSIWPEMRPNVRTTPTCPVLTCAKLKNTVASTKITLATPTVSRPWDAVGIALDVDAVGVGVAVEDQPGADPHGDDPDDGDEDPEHGGSQIDGASAIARGGIVGGRPYFRLFPAHSGTARANSAAARLLMIRIVQIGTFRGYGSLAVAHDERLHSRPDRRAAGRRPEGVPDRALGPAAARRAGAERPARLPGARERGRDDDPHGHARLGARAHQPPDRRREGDPGRGRRARAALLDAARPGREPAGRRRQRAAADQDRRGLQGPSRALRLQGDRRAAQPVPRRELDPAGGARQGAARGSGRSIPRTPS